MTCHSVSDWECGCVFGVFLTMPSPSLVQRVQRYLYLTVLACVICDGVHMSGQQVTAGILSKDIFGRL